MIFESPGYFILLVTLKVLFIISLILILSDTKFLRKYDEFKIASIGALFFMYVSWLVTYTAQIQPFIEPKFKSHY